MNDFIYQTRIWLPRPRDEVFAFFGEARNLETLTPGWLHFDILTPSPIAMRAGTLIDYRIRVHGIPFRWRTEITEWDPPRCFVDVQVRGPYRRWHHTHRFEEGDGGTWCEDRVEYRPIGGRLMQVLFVRRDVERIFAFRARRLRELFPAADGSSAVVSAPRGAAGRFAGGVGERSGVIE